MKDKRDMEFIRKTRRGLFSRQAQIAQERAEKIARQCERQCQEEQALGWKDGRWVWDRDRSNT